MQTLKSKFQDSCGFAMLANLDGIASEEIIQKSIQGLDKLSHRGTVAADGKSSDGCGILFKIEKESVLNLINTENIVIPNQFAIAVLYLSPDQEKYDKSLNIFNQELEKKNMGIFSIREVPIKPEYCGHRALKDLPRIIQVFVNLDFLEIKDELKLNLELLKVRKQVEQCHREESSLENFYCASFSTYCISYKALVTTENLANFYPDLKESKLKSSICLFHQRFSTNTHPEWKLAQPFRMLAHNGEINTIDGNRSWSLTRNKELLNEDLQELAEIRELINQSGSDSMSLDNLLELLNLGGIDLNTAIKLLMPPSYQKNPSYNQELKSMYEYYSHFMEAWDGPAAIVAFNNSEAICSLDRNGLRPARYCITNKNEFLIGSEIGIIDYELEDIIEHGKLNPGETISLEFDTKRITNNKEIERKLSHKHNYHKLIEEGTKQIVSPLKIQFEDDFALEKNIFENIKTYYKYFQISLEEIKNTFPPLANNSNEAISSMGDDASLAALSSKKRNLFDYFRQRFAQVTNPAIDSIREKNVMSLETFIGPAQNIFSDFGKMQERLKLKTPVLDQRKLQEIIQLKQDKICKQDLNIHMDQGLHESIEKLKNLVLDQVTSGKELIILSDAGIKDRHYLLHPLLALTSVNYFLTEKGLRSKVNIILETAHARDPHHFAVFIAFGATAVYPYLSYQIIRKINADISSQEIEHKMHNYQYGIEQGLLKIMSKMGISIIKSYRGSALFDIFGLGEDFTENIFIKNSSLINGMSIKDYEEEMKSVSSFAWNKNNEVEIPGIIKYRKDGESHAYVPEQVNLLQEAVRENSAEKYNEYKELVNKRNIISLRDLLELAHNREPISIDEVEEVSEIVKRFTVSAMSLGAISPEAHEAISEAMNEINARSNSGEGGEDKSRYNTIKNSKIKQVASGRFGVDAEYLISAEAIQIKIAQGAKPGEGGQLPGFKVNELIAKLRCTKEGTTLISPPPHHDIYSIEDLSQLIFDLKQVNPKAEISVKLVSSSNTATVACGVAKAYADNITIAGADGGTGASPLTSIRYAGLPWEYGLAETHKLLLENNLRNKVSLQVDGGMKTGLDVVKAAILGAETFGFGTNILISLGCKYLRVCHLNTCPTGIATQKEELRQKYFKGLSEHVVNYMYFIANEIREILASLGIRSMSELIGKTNLLKRVNSLTTKQSQINIDELINFPEDNSSYENYILDNPCADKSILTKTIISDVSSQIAFKDYINLSYKISNTDRSVASGLNHYLLKNYKKDFLAEKQIDINLKGYAGQSFGSFLIDGLSLSLDGIANDYVGKSLSGGRIIIKSPSNTRFASSASYAMGNTCLYGAIKGKLFANSKAGERFAIRNSGAQAVIEGLGDHGCEYMTGGLVLILGEIGNNFGAGMTGGIAIVLDEKGNLQDKVNSNFVEVLELNSINSFELNEIILGLLAQHKELTESAKAKIILNDYEKHKNSLHIVKSYNSDIYEQVSYTAANLDCSFK
ncbi:MAG: glutamate synthase large subunit [Candidatus Caenarcaniphilales bacterium]|nr:glutamate synthase large subunit [Candidatus Caenarcaniphilales bacterium]